MRHTFAQCIVESEPDEGVWPNEFLRVCSAILASPNAPRTYGEESQDLQRATTITIGSISTPCGLELNHLRCNGAPVNAEENDSIEHAMSPAHRENVSTSRFGMRPMADAPTPDICLFACEVPAQDGRDRYVDHHTEDPVGDANILGCCFVSSLTHPGVETRNMAHARGLAGSGRHSRQCA